LAFKRGRPVIRSVGSDGRIETGGVFTPIYRGRIVERIAMAAQEHITLVVAPAGYGKSVALTQYLSTLRQPLIRYDVRADNDTLLGFVRGFVSALSDISPTVRNTLAEAFEPALTATSPGAELAYWVHAHIKDYRGVAAIDDLHVCEKESEVTTFLTTLIERTKQEMKWIIATRSTLDLPVASWLAYGDMGLPVDETDLRFTAEEARHAARTSRVTVREEELNAILGLIDGWPTALTFALRSAVRSTDLQHLETETRDKIYRYLAEQVFRALSPDQRELLWLASFLNDIDTAVLRAAGYGESEKMFEALRRRVAFIYKEGEGRYRCHDLFRDFLQFELRLSGEKAYREKQLAAARALRESDRDAPALALFSQANAMDESLDMIEDHGAELIEHGHGDVVGRAVGLLPKHLQNMNPSVLAIRASAEMMAGRFDSAEHLYKRAIALSEDATFKASAGIRLLVLMTNQGKDACAVLEPMLHTEELAADMRAEVISALASSHALAGRKEVARPLVHEALELSDYCETEEARMRALQRIGFASFYIGEYDIARKTSTECARLAEQLGYFVLAARAYSVLTVTEMSCDEGVSNTLWCAQQNAACAGKGGDRLGLQTALFHMYEIEARRGNVERMATIDTEIAAMHTSDPFRAAVILPLRALRLAWDGHFADAHRLACGVCDKQAFVSARALRTAECAVYLATDGRKAEAMRYAEMATECSTTARASSPYESQQLRFAVVFVALAYGIVGRASWALQALRHTVASLESASVAALGIASSALLRAVKSPAYDRPLHESLEQLRRLEHGGYALLIEAIFCHMQQARNQAVRGLTRAEIDVLAALSTGGSAKRIAQERGRSVHTIQAHIRSIIDKLGCSGRGEALAIARREGILTE